MDRKFDIKQQLKVWVVGAASGWLATRLGLPTEQSVAIGAAAGGLFDVAYWLVVVRWLRLA